MKVEQPSLSRVEPLSRHHLLSEFDCKKHPSLNEWLKRWAWVSQQSDSSRVYVVHRSNIVVGYYAICTGSVSRSDAPERISKGQPGHPVSVILLARLAVDYREQGRGLGKALLKSALLRIASAAEIVGSRAVLVHAIDEEARRFYEHFGFEKSLVDPLHLMLLMKDLRMLLKE